MATRRGERPDEGAGGERGSPKGGEPTVEGLERRLAEVEAELRAELARKTAELEAARATAELASRAKTAFLANMSHEIRTPLSAVMGYANLIAATEQAQGETREWSRRLQRSAEHLLALLDDVLDLAKIEAGKLDVHLVACDPMTVLEEVGVLMEPRAREKGLELVVTADTELPTRLRTDPLRLRQILVNLVGNAVKYTPRGEVAVRARVRMSPVGRSFSRRFEVEVADTGVGISGEEIARLFRPFEQGATRPRAGGVGLGLDIARRLARMLGGEIEVRSQVGVGSQFLLSLPADTGGERGTTPARLVTRSGLLKSQEPLVPRLDGCVVLVVDDAEDNRLVVRHFLEQAGAVVLEAATLLAARRILAEPGSGVELAITDLQLPDGDGLELVGELAARGDGRPVLALTADAMLETRERAMALGVADFLVKPVVAWRLVSRVAALLAGRPGRRADAADGSGRVGAGEGSGRAGSVEVGASSRRPGRTPVPPLAGLTRRPTPSKPQRGGEEAAGEGAGEGGPRKALRRHPTSPNALPRAADPQRVVTAPSPRPGVVAEVERPDVPEDLLRRFYSLLTERVLSLEEGIATRNAASLRDVAHRIAGSGATMGHPELTRIGREVEGAVARGEAWETIEEVGRLMLEATRSAARSRPWLP